MERLPEKVDGQEKERVLSFIKNTSIVCLVLGICSVGIGIAVLALLDGTSYVLKTGTGIWYGIITIVFGILGIAAAISTNEITQRKMLTGHYIMSIIMMSQGYALANAIQGLVVCSKGDEECGSNSEAKAALRGVLIGIILVVYVLGIMSMGIHNRKRQLLHPEWKGGCCGW